jgi:hypothetical protein
MTIRSLFRWNGSFSHLAKPPIESEADASREKARMPHSEERECMAMGILNNMARKLNGFFLEEAPCGSTGFFTHDSI